jgi:hypothetical protein
MSFLLPTHSPPPPSPPRLPSLFSLALYLRLTAPAGSLEPVYTATLQAGGWRSSTCGGVGWGLERKCRSWVGPPDCECYGQGGSCGERGRGGRERDRGRNKGGRERLLRDGLRTGLSYLRHGACTDAQCRRAEGACSGDRAVSSSVRRHPSRFLASGARKIAP